MDPLSLLFGACDICTAYSDIILLRNIEIDLSIRQE